MTGRDATSALFADFREKAERRGRRDYPDGDATYETPDWRDVMLLLAIAESAICRRFTAVPCMERPELSPDELCLTCAAKVEWEVIHGGR